MTLIRHRRWATLAGILLFIGMMATGYYYNVTFVQLGLIDLGERIIGLSGNAVAAHMAALALVTCVVALATGLLLGQRPLQTRLRLALAVVTVQTLLTAVTPLVQTPAAFLGWILAAAAALGVGMPVTFSLTVDLVPTRYRGYVAGIITAAAYFAAAALPSEWRVEQFRAQMLLPMIGGALTLAVLALPPLPLTQALARQHTEPAFAQGRFVLPGPEGGHRISRSLLLLVVLMFAIFFIDSLGFLRIIATPEYVQSSWQAPTLTPHLVIAVAHVVAALAAGVLYTALDERHLFFWVFGIFALVHLLYTFPFEMGNANAGEVLAAPLLYAVAVSLYTVVNFAIWADISTPATIARNAAVGVALSGWTATFISTSLATYWQTTGLAVTDHLRRVDALALLIFVVLLALPFLPRLTPPPQDLPRQLPRELKRETHET